VRIGTCAALVERELELAQIGAALDAAADGGGRLVVVDGPAGIGKSGLLGWACAGAVSVGSWCLRAWPVSSNGSSGWA
jgi:AAA ATPase domain